MRKILLPILAATAFAAVPATAGAAPSEQGECRQAAHDLGVAASEEGTYGDFISDGIYGNEPNVEDGQTVPSQSPGPQVNNGAKHGFTVGDLQALVRAACNA